MNVDIFITDTLVESSVYVDYSIVILLRKCYSILFRKPIGKYNDVVYH